MWYSLDKTFEVNYFDPWSNIYLFSYQEPAIGLARKLLDFIKADEKPPEVIKESLEALKLFDEKQAKAIAVVNGIKKPGHFQFHSFACMNLCVK